jgi:hypothetical protein
MCTLFINMKKEEEPCEPKRSFNFEQNKTVLFLYWICSIDQIERPFVPFPGNEQRSISIIKQAKQKREREQSGDREQTKRIKAPFAAATSYPIDANGSDPKPHGSHTLHRYGGRRPVPRRQNRRRRTWPAAWELDLASIYMGWCARTRRVDGSLCLAEGHRSILLDEVGKEALSLLLVALAVATACFLL